VLIAALVIACEPSSVALESPTTVPAATGLPIATTGAIDSGGPPAAGLQGLVVVTLGLKLPRGVSRAVAFGVGRNVLLAGGLTRSGTTTTILEVDLARGRVVVIGHLAAAVHDAAGAIVGNTPMVFGGGNRAPGSVVQLAGAGTGSTVGNLPAPRADLAAADLAGETIVVGGGTPARLDRAVLATTDGVRFRAVASLAVGVRYPAVAAIGGLLFVIGGTDGSHELAQIQRFDPATGSVTVLGSLPQGLAHASALVIAGHLLVAGGRTGGTAQDAIWEVDPATGAATLIGRLPWAVSDAAAIVVDGVGYLLGGETDSLRTSIVSIGAN
jgi:hypothetical protein